MATLNASVHARTFSIRSISGKRRVFMFMFMSDSKCSASLYLSASLCVRFLSSGCVCGIYSLVAVAGPDDTVHAHIKLTHFVIGIVHSDAPETLTKPTTITISSSRSPFSVRHIGNVHALNVKRSEKKANKSGQ